MLVLDTDVFVYVFYYVMAECEFVFVSIYFVIQTYISSYHVLCVYTWVCSAK